MNLFVAKLSPTTTAKDLETLFEAFGEILSTKVIIDRFTGNSKGYGFVEMKNDDEALAAIEALNETDFKSSTIVVKESQPKSPSHGHNRDHSRRHGSQHS